ncbi:MAG: ATP-binding protein [Candidatus Ratteibacteria bacterium]|nr:ATP-binding protein [Candidatus Ratteibacteria bacterium]
MLIRLPVTYNLKAKLNSNLPYHQEYLALQNRDSSPHQKSRYGDKNHFLRTFHHPKWRGSLFAKIFALSIYFLLFNRVYSATDLPKESDNLVLMVFLGIVIIGLIIAFILTAFAKQTVYIEDKKSEGAKDQFKSLSPTIIKEIDRLVNPRNKKQAVKIISDLFQEEVKKKIDATTQEISKKYGTIIEGKNQLIKKTEEKYARTDLEKKHTESIIRNIAEGLVVVNNKGEVLVMNPSAKKLLGVKEGEKKDKLNLSNLSDKYLVALMDSTKENKEIIVQSSNDDTKKVLRASSAVIENENGKTVGMVSVLTDVTKQKELEEMKSSFLSNVSHELRTPLVSIQKSVDLILSKSAGEITESQEKFLSITDRNLKRLNQLINDLLDLSKLEAKKVSLELKPTQISKVIDDACESLKSWADSKSIKIDKIVPANLPDIDMDYSRIIQVFNNLIGNAIKFTPQNGIITIEIQLREGNKKLQISVSDTGIGIDEKDLDKIFDKFQQCGERAATDISGTGLGLSITKEIVQLHKGDIWAESKKDKGAKFTFTLPIQNTNSVSNQPKI